MSARIPCPIYAQSLQNGEAAAIITPHFTWSYTDLHHRVSQAAERLDQMGLKAGSKIILFTPPDARFIVLLAAILRLGGIAAPLNPGLSTVECQAAADHLKPEFVLSESIKITGYPHLELTQMIEATGPPPSEKKPSLALSQLATIIRTSGSTGHPKYAVHTLANHLRNAEGSATNIPVGPGSRWLLSLPVYHVSGLSILFRSWVGGGAIVIPDLGEALEVTLSRFLVTHVSLVVTQLYRLLAAGFEGSRLKAVLLGGSGFPDDLVRKAYEAGFPLYKSYGSTEAASQITTTPPNSALETLLSSGRCLPNREIKLSQDEEILLRGNTLFSGYYDKNGIISLPLDTEGWFHTQDLGRWDEDGNLHVVGRKDLMFISGGENIQPEEIERCLLEHPRVKRCLVVPVPDPEFGQRPVAFIDPLEASADYLSFLADTLSKFKIPKVYLPWPNDSSGIKPNRAVFADQAKEITK